MEKETALATTNIMANALTENDIQEQVNIIQKVMKKVMQKDVHYGVIPGCGNKPTLLKAGSEKILSTFRIGVDPVVEDLSTEDEVKYRVIARGIYYPTGTYLGAGVGVASSNEDKYKWKKASCKEEFEDTPEKRRRIKYTSRMNGVMKIQQIRTNPSDLANTILKMSKKRAQIDMTLTVTGASDIFTQDIEEMDIATSITGKATKPAVDMPKEKEADKSPADIIAENLGQSPAHKRTPATMFALAKKLGVSESKIKTAMRKNFNKDKTSILTPDEIDELIEWIKDYANVVKKNGK